jgi:membrane protease YdiL (CAAX protease family)
MIVLFTLLLAWMTYRSNVMLQQFRPDFNVLLSPPENVSRLVLVLVCLFLAWSSGLPLQTLGFISPQPLNSLLWGLGIGLATQIVLNVATYLAIHFLGPQVYSPWLIINILPIRPMEWLFIPLAFLPAVAMEELLFRSLLLGGFSGLMSLPLLVLATSLLFGFMHLPQGRLGVVAAAGINVLLAGLFLWSGEFLICLTTHYTINVLQVVLAYHQREWLEKLI